MVNRGRSAGCLTCKQRRVKCDETKPECKVCQRLRLPCEGYKPTYAKLKFRDQTHKFYTGAGSKKHVGSQSGEAAGGLTLQRPSEPDTAVPFYLNHYASMGRDMGSTRGFFELLIPAYHSQPQDSALSLAVSAVASETLSLWRHDPSGFRSPRKSYSRALTRLRIATQDPVERGNPATLLAALALQTFENASAVFVLRQASSTHHNGATSLLPFMDSDDMDGTVRAYLRQFMLHTEVSSAMRQKKPLRSIAYSWIPSKDMTTVPENPSSALDALGVSVVELQASYMHFMTEGGSTPLFGNLLAEWRAKAKRVDAELLAWVENVPDHWRPQRLISGLDIDSSIPTYQSICEVYPSCQISSIWNLWRFQRLLLAKMILGSLGAFSNLNHVDFSDEQAVENITDFFNSQQTLQEMADGVCYSIPFHLGNRTTWSSLTDFTNSTILLPSHSTRGLIDDHWRHIIAQGPWRAMHPLSRFLTLFSEDRGVISSFLRPGQREWICDQFLRVATILRLPSESCNDIEGLRSPVESEDVKAQYLAKQIRKGAILMSGP